MSAPPVGAISGLSRGGGSMEQALRGSAPEHGDGTQQSGYVTPELGPFECDNCEHFEAPSSCNHPMVVSDPEVQGQVEAKGCCNYFKSLSGAAPAGPARPEGE